VGDDTKPASMKMIDFSNHHSCRDGRYEAAVLRGLKIFVGVIPMLLGILAGVSLVLTSVTPRGPRTIIGPLGCPVLGLGNT